MGKWVYIPDDDEIKILVLSKITEFKESLKDESEVFLNTYGIPVCYHIVTKAKDIETLNGGLLELPEWITAVAGASWGMERCAIIYAMELLMEEYYDYESESPIL